jgi:hypothetical protein
MPPNTVYIIVWSLEGDRTMPMLTNRASYLQWLESPELYAQKRISRWNKRAGGRLIAATGMEIHEFRRVHNGT